MNTIMVIVGFKYKTEPEIRCILYNIPSVQTKKLCQVNLAALKMVKCKHMYSDNIYQVFVLIYA